MAGHVRSTTNGAFSMEVDFAETLTVPTRPSTTTNNSRLSTSQWTMRGGPPRHSTITTRLEDEILTTDAGCEASPLDGRDVRTPTIRTRPLFLTEHISIFFAIYVPCLTLLLAWSKIGYGFQLFNTLGTVKAPEQLALGLCGGAAGFVVLYFILGCSVRAPCLRFLWYLVVWGVLVSCCVLVGPRHPWLPMFLCPVHQCLFVALLRVRFGFIARRRRFFMSVFRSCFLVSVLIGAFLLLWKYRLADQEDYWYTQSTVNKLVDLIPDIYKTIYPKRPLDYALDCAPGVLLKDETLRAREQIQIACNTAQSVVGLVWFCPMISIFFNTTIGLFCLLFGVVLNIRDSDQIGRILGWYIALLTTLMGLFALSLEWHDKVIQTGGLLQASLFAATGACMLWLYHELGHNKVAIMVTQKSHRFADSRLLVMISDIALSEWCQACILIPFSLVFLLLYVVTSAHRYILHICDRRHRNDSEKMIYWVSDSLAVTMKTWHWPMLLHKICIICELFFVFSVGVTQLTPVFLAYVNDQLTGLDIGLVTAVLYFVGFFMFMLPPVPGVPVYIFYGVVLGKQGANAEWLGFWGGVALACFLSWFVKMTASLGQYVIGYCMGRSIKVQQAVGVHTMQIRAVAEVVKSPQLSLGKLLLLVAGPDWPTSVLCGLLEVNLWQMMLGTAPVAFVTTPCTMAGAFQSMTTPGENNEWNTWSTALTGASAVVLVASASGAALQIAKVIEEQGDELEEEREEHRAILELEAEVEQYNQKHRRANEWHRLGCLRKISIVLAALTMCSSVIALAALNEFLFNDFGVASKIEDPMDKGGLDGDWLNIVVAPHGWITLSFFAGGVCLHILFACDSHFRTWLEVEREPESGWIEEPSSHEA